MSTPPYATSPYRVIENAYFEAGKIEEGQEPNSEQLAKGMVRLQDMANLWQTQGLKLWLQLDLPVTLVSGQAVYSLGPTGNVVMTRPTRVIEAYYAYPPSSGSTIRPVFIYSRNDWDTLGQRSTQGPINAVFPDKQIANLIVNCWMTPDDTEAQGVLHLIIQQQQPGIVQLTDTMQFSPEWFIALVWGLADQLATGAPITTIQKCQSNAERYRTMLEDWDVEDASTTFAADTTRGGGFGSKFS